MFMSYESYSDHVKNVNHNSEVNAHVFWPAFFSLIGLQSFGQRKAGGGNKNKNNICQAAYKVQGKSQYAPQMDEGH